jgi:hypothetical protein
VVELIIVRDKATNESKGSAFAWFRGAADADRAIAQLNMRHAPPDPSGEPGRPLVVRRAQARAGAGGSGSGGGGRAGRHASAPHIEFVMGGGSGGLSSGSGGPVHHTAPGWFDAGYRGGPPAPRLSGGAAGEPQQQQLQFQPAHHPSAVILQQQQQQQQAAANSAAAVMYQPGAPNALSGWQSAAAAAPGGAAGPHHQQQYHQMHQMLLQPDGCLIQQFGPSMDGSASQETSGNLVFSGASATMLSSGPNLVSTTSSGAAGPGGPPHAHLVVAGGGGRSVMQLAEHAGVESLVRDASDPGGSILSTMMQLPLTAAQMQAVNNHIYSIQTMSGAEVTSKAVAPGVFCLVLRGLKPQVDVANQLIAAVLQHSAG